MGGVGQKSSVELSGHRELCVIGNPDHLGITPTRN